MQGQAAADEVRFLSVCLMRAALRRRGIPNLQARSPDGRHTWLYVLVVRYTYDSSVQALDLPGAATTRRQGAGPTSHNHTVLVVVNLLSKVI